MAENQLSDLEVELRGELRVLLSDPQSPHSKVLAIVKRLAEIESNRNLAENRSVLLKWEQKHNLTGGKDGPANEGRLERAYPFGLWLRWEVHTGLLQVRFGRVSNTLSAFFLTDGILEAALAPCYGFLVNGIQRASEELENLKTHAAAFKQQFPSLLPEPL